MKTDLEAAQELIAELKFKVLDLERALPPSDWRSPLFREALALLTQERDRLKAQVAELDPGMKEATSKILDLIAKKSALRGRVEDLEAFVEKVALSTCRSRTRPWSIRLSTRTRFAPELRAGLGLDRGRRRRREFRAGPITQTQELHSLSRAE